jgi:hypothetical protein
VAVRNLFKYSAFGRLLLIPCRGAYALASLRRPFVEALRWTFRSRELYNFTYDLSELNKQYLASFIAVVSGHEPAEIERYCAELEGDERLKSHIRAATLASPDRYNSDAEPRFGRRLGWYALLRATKPRVVVETGVDKGLGTCLIAAALMRNQAEGYPGFFYATDNNPKSGNLFSGAYRDYGRVLYGDSVDMLGTIKDEVDIFIHDSDHRAEYEMREFLAMEKKLVPNAIVLSDNANETDKLLEFARRIGKTFLFFQDQPKHHWWRGDGIGAAFTPGARTVFGRRGEERPGK